MKNLILIGAAIFAMGSSPASAGGSFSLNFFSPEPVYYAPPPPPPQRVVYYYPSSYSYYYPSYNYVNYDRGYRKHYDRHDRYDRRHEGRHNQRSERHDNRGRGHGRD